MRREDIKPHGSAADSLGAARFAFCMGDEQASLDHGVRKLARIVALGNLSPELVPQRHVLPAAIFRSAPVAGLVIDHLIHIAAVLANRLEAGRAVLTEEFT